MTIFKRIFLAVIAIISVCSTASGVTKEEFEQARTIAAIWYLRYSNDGSGYLEELSPKTLAELESKLKAKEKENIKGFKAVTMPTDYASWDKNKLVDYWSNTFFSSPGIPADAKRAKMRVSRKISGLEIAAPSQQKTETEEPRMASQDTVQKPVEPVATPEAVNPVENTTIDADANADADAQERKKSNDSSTTVYVIVLAILVTIVVALVVYAMNSMKRGSNTSSNDKKNASEELEKMRNSFAERLAQKNEEIEDMRKTIEALSHKIQILESNSAKNATRYTERKVSAATPRVIYLSRANSKGIFLRADAKFSLGNSIFQLITTNGVSGTFSIIEDATVHEMALMMPQDFLINACTGKNLQLAQGMHAISTDEPGTAIFEDGTWRVVRKAQIHYIS